MKDDCERFIAALPPSTNSVEDQRRLALRREASHIDFYKARANEARRWNGWGWQSAEEKNLRRVLMFQDNYAALRATF